MGLGPTKQLTKMRILNPCVFFVRFFITSFYLQHLYCKLFSVCYSNRNNSHDNESFLYVSIHLAYTVLLVNAPLSLSLF